MTVVDKLIEITYNKIFYENLNFLKKDIEDIKNIILKNRKLLNSELDKLLFIEGIAEKIKTKKIDEANRQKEKYGQVLMNQFEHILALYEWVCELSNNPKKEKIDNSEIWLKDEVALNCLSSYLFDKGLIDEAVGFKKCIRPERGDNRTNWLSSKTLLIYLFDILKKHGYIHSALSENSFIEANFMLNGEYIENIKQSKNATKDNKNSKPKNHLLIDSFFESK